MLIEELDVSFLPAVLNTCQDVQLTGHRAKQHSSDALRMSAEEWQRCIGAEAGAVCGGQAARAHGHGAPEGAAAHARRHAAAQHCPAGPARHADACPDAAVPGWQEAGEHPARQVSVPTTLNVIITWRAALLGSLPITARCSQDM